ncbi:ATP-binding cassette domain-containing protein, partial [Paenibacillus sp.]|uniref:ATP-binding cassette domain-containing protein n=1 Tax=Paenibacillus sp. TaxID=58172 RepID=UPI002D590B50
MFIVQARGLEKEWNGKTIFANVDIDVREGEKVALVGRNGAGKTTLLSLLLGEAEPTAGAVRRFVAPQAWGRLEQ